MKTTALIAEILIVGIGAAIWLLLLLIAYFPEARGLMQLLTLTWLLPAIAVVYVLGIIFDKAADVLLTPLESIAFRGLNMKDVDIDDWKNERDSFLRENEYSQVLYFSNQSRKKILRGWVLNFIGIGIGLAVTELQAGKAQFSSSLIWTSAAVAIFLSVLCFLLWLKFARDQVKVFKRLLGTARIECELTGED